MKAAILALLAEYPKLLTLGDLGNLRANQLTVAHLQRIAGALDTQIPFTDEIVTAFVELLKGKDIGSVADLIQRPDSIRDVILFLKGGFHGLIEAKQSSGSELTEEAALLFIGN